MEATQILEKQINQSRQELPFSLKVNHLVVLTNTSQSTIYESLQKGEIPGAKKINGSWRVSRDVFLSWWYGEEMDQ